MRRNARFLAAAIGCALLAAPPATSADPHRPPARVRVTLPAPTGPYAVGTRSIEVTDPGRPDPWKPSEKRRLMTSVFYPTREHGRPAAQFAAADAAAFDAANTAAIRPRRVAWGATRLRASVGVPVLPHRRALPVVLYSPGAGDPRDWNSTLVTDLASHGVVVVTVDHTHESGAVQFPDGEVARGVALDAFAAAEKAGSGTRVLEKLLKARVDDLRSVLDLLPAELGFLGPVDVRHVGAFGHSAGGFAAAEAMYEDPRITAGLDFDGVLAFVTEDSDPGHLSAAAAHGVDRRFLLVGNPGNTARTSPSWAAFVANSHGHVRTRTVAGTAHGSFTDAVAVVPQLRRAGVVDAKTARDDIGTADPRRTLDRTRTIVERFFAPR